MSCIASFYLWRCYDIMGIIPIALHTALSTYDTYAVVLIIKQILAHNICSTYEVHGRVSARNMFSEIEMIMSASMLLKINSVSL